MDTTGSHRTATGPSGLTGLLAPAWRQGGNPTIDELIERLRRRWRLRQVLQGLVAALVAGAALFLAAAWLLNLWHFHDNAVWGLRLAILASAGALLWHFCLRPLRRQVSDSQVALYLEEREPALGGMLAGAVDAARATEREVSPQLAAGLARRALDASRDTNFGDGAEARAIRSALGKLALVSIVICALALWPPQFLRFGAPALLMPWTGAAEYSPYRIELEPGNIEIARGADLPIVARIDGFDGSDVRLLTSADGGASWQEATMTQGNEAGSYEHFLFDIGTDLDYYVEGAGQRTPAFRVTVTDIPEIREIGLRFHFPAYTGLEPRTKIGSGDIDALKGTRVEVLIQPTIDIPGGELLFGDDSSIALERGADGIWSGAIEVREDAIYRVRLQRKSGVAVDASPEYRIVALEDQHPSVSILSPGRDTKVSVVEEPLMRVRADDDQGIATLQLVMSVNGAAEEVIQLMPNASVDDSGRQVEAEHVVYLEDLGLRPGDLISYYAKAQDRSPAERQQSATSDIFFYQVRPFSTHYRSAQQQGGGGGGGGSQGQQQGHLSEQQKQFVVATFKMLRDRDSYSEEAWLDNLELLATAEARIRDRVEAIVRRIGRRPIVQVDERYQVVMNELPLAAEAMVEVEKLLKEAEIDSALVDAQRALLHLQRADAAFREINVSMSNQSGGGSAGSNSNMNDLADLFRLEMDKLRNQYETVQRGQQQAPEQVIDETLERLRELARRQQRELERQLRRRDQGTGGDAASRQRALAEELEEMARQLERLTREQRNQRLQQSVAQMRQAAEAMRRAAENAEGGGGAGEARAAAESLREAQRLLDQGRVQQFSEAVEQSLRRAELAEKKQASIKREIAEMKELPGKDLEQHLDRLQERKEGLTEDLARLETDLNELVGEARDEQPKAGEAIKRALRAGRENRLQDRIGRTRAMLELGEREYALANEGEIQKGIADIRKHIESALAEVGEPPERGMQRSLEQLRDLARELRFSREREAGRQGSGERQASRQDSGGRGTQAQGGAATGGNANGSNGYAITGVQPLRENLDNLARRTRELGHRLSQQGVDSGDIDPVLEQIEELARNRDPADVDALRESALLALMELEYELRQNLEGDEKPTLSLSESSEIPEEYDDMVADYFRRLSRP